MGETEKVVGVKKIPTAPTQEASNRELYATVAYFYPQYTLKDVAKLRYKDVVLLLRVAQKKEAEKYLTLTHIAAAPHTKNGDGVKKLIKDFKKIIDG